VNLIQAAMTDGCSLNAACNETDISLRTYRRWLCGGEFTIDKRPDAIRPEPPNKLSETERQTIIETCNEPEYANLPPTQIVPILLDEGIYHASESSYYRVLKGANQLHHRGRSQAPKKVGKPTSFTPRKANEVWSWDITYLGSTIKGRFYYLYLFEDIFSRKVVGYEVYEQECGERAGNLLQRCMLREQCLNTPLVLHSDNGAPMKAQTMKAKMEELGVLPSYSRPRVSDDNPYSEALFRTLKYRPEWPSSGFGSLEVARDWVQNFVEWYNNKHRHSKINFVTPAQRHHGEEKAILSNRELVLEKKKEANPLRWSRDVRDCRPAGPVSLNPEKESIKSEHKDVA
jgi:putative transposase